MFSTVTQLKDFQQSGIWRDMQAELNEWIQDLQMVLEDPDGTLEVEVLSVTRGSIRALRNVLMMPQVLTDNLIDDSDREARKRKREKKS